MFSAETVFRSNFRRDHKVLAGNQQKQLKFYCTAPTKIATLIKKSSILKKNHEPIKTRHFMF